MSPVPTPDAIVDARRKLGLTIEQLTPPMAEKYHLSTEDGLFVLEVVRDSVAAKAGLQAGRRHRLLGRYRVSNLNDFGTLLRRLPDAGHVRIGVIRGDQVGYGILRPSLLDEDRHRPRQIQRARSTPSLLRRPCPAAFARFTPTRPSTTVPLADGGEGTVAALVAATGGRLITQRVTGPLPGPQGRRDVSACWATGTQPSSRWRPPADWRCSAPRTATR